VQRSPNDHGHLHQNVVGSVCLVLDFRPRGTGCPQPGVIDGYESTEHCSYLRKLRVCTESSIPTSDPKGTGHGMLCSLSPSHNRPGYRHWDLGLAVSNQTREGDEIRSLGFIICSGPCNQPHHPGPTQFRQGAASQTVTAAPTCIWETG
jgi:hypothetical protein